MKYIFIILLLIGSHVHGQDNDPWLDNLTTVGATAFGGDANVYGNIADGSYEFEKNQSYNSYSAYQPNRNNVLSGRIGANVTLGCDGINVGTILESRFSEYEAVIESIYSELPAFTMYYLLYSNPTVAEYLDMLNTEFGWALELASLSCQDARKYAEENPFDYGTKYGKDGCVGEEGGNNSNCVGDNDEQAEEAKERKVADIRVRLSDYVRLQSANNASTREQTERLARYTNIPIDTSCNDDYSGSAGSTSAINWTETVLILGNVPCYHKEIYGQLLPTIKQEGEELNEGIDAVNRESSVQKIYTAIGNEYFHLIDAAVKNAAVRTDSDGSNPIAVPRGSGGNLLVSEGSDALRAIVVRSGIPLATHILADLQNAYTNDQSKYVIAISQMADRLALAEVSSRLVEFQTGVKAGIAVAHQNRDLPFPVSEELNRVNESLTSELNIILQRQSISASILSDHNKLF